MPSKRAHIIYRGRVQGVGFRWSAQDAARRAGVTGWVRNNPEGTVEVVSEGEEKDICSFLEYLKEEMDRYISSSDIKWGKPTGEFESFSIKFF